MYSNWCRRLQRLRQCSAPLASSSSRPTGKLLAWSPERNLGYDHVLLLTWDFLEHKVPIGKTLGTAARVYLTFAMYDEHNLQRTYWQHNPASTFAHLMDDVNWYGYSGDKESIRVMRGMFEYKLLHGTTPKD